ncbi:unnamed protein product [Caenorhabditis angaria]|uniref:Uncharacterized protein n=1 Tax=Caenorhabditis angaria TaxID=860376 RepID=A0A9P1I8I0_9PELO|nr:unnamed protein product [Caenorhabditis angaria]
MSTTTTATPKTELENPKKEEPTGGKQFIIVGIIVVVLMVIAGASMFTILFTQSKIDEGPKNSIEKQKADTIAAIDEAIKVVEGFPRLLDNSSPEQISPKLFKLIREKLGLANLTESELLEEHRNSGFQEVYIEIKDNAACPRPPPTLILEKVPFIKLLNKAAEGQREKLKKINDPINIYEATFVELLRREFEKSGALSKKILVGYSKSIIKMLKEFKKLTVARYDSIIQSYEKQIAARKIADIGVLVMAITCLSITCILLVTIMILFILYQKQKISFDKLKRYSNILLLVSVIFAISLLIYAVVGSIGISPFGYDCKLKLEEQTSDMKFTNFDGKVIDIGSITSGCKKGESVYSKMAPQLNAQNIRTNLDNLENVVTTFTDKLQFDSPFNSYEISDLSIPVEQQHDELSKYKKKPCMKDVLVYLNDMLNKVEVILKSLEALKQYSKEISDKNLKADFNQFIPASFESLKTVTDNAVNSINDQFDKTDIKCYQEVPGGLCNEYSIYFNNVMIVNWIMFGIIFLIVVLSKLLIWIPKSIIRKKEKMEEKEEKPKNENLPNKEDQKIAPAVVDGPNKDIKEKKEEQGKEEEEKEINELLNIIKTLKLEVANLKESVEGQTPIQERPDQSKPADHDKPANSKNDKSSKSKKELRKTIADLKLEIAYLRSKKTAKKPANSKNGQKSKSKSRSEKTAKSEFAKPPIVIVGGKDVEGKRHLYQFGIPAHLQDTIE